MTFNPGTLGCVDFELSGCKVSPVFGLRDFSHKLLSKDLTGYMRDAYRDPQIAGDQIAGESTLQDLPAEGAWTPPYVRSKPAPRSLFPTAPRLDRMDIF